MMTITAWPRLIRCLTVSPRAMTSIGTHDGAFHCDEALGCWLLKRTERFADAEIIRTRDPKVLETMDVVLDVGGVYNPGKVASHVGLNFERELWQRSRDLITIKWDLLRCLLTVHSHLAMETREESCVGYRIKLSSAGLIYKHFGKEILKQLVDSAELKEEDLDAVYLKVYKGFIEAVDGIDNGITVCAEKYEAQYTDSTGLSARVGRLNPAWNESDPAITSDGQFKKAMEMCGQEFLDYALRTAKVWLPARSHVQTALAERFSVSQTGEIIELRTFCPWQEHLAELETEQNLEGAIKYCIFEDSIGDGSFRVRTVPVAAFSFLSRRPLPVAWRGLRFEELDKASGIEGCIFVHSNGFIGGHKTREGALKMAEAALAMRDESTQ